MYGFFNYDFFFMKECLMYGFRILSIFFCYFLEI